jgi:hypothetical protein
MTKLIFSEKITKETAQFSLGGKKLPLKGKKLQRVIGNRSYFVRVKNGQYYLDTYEYQRITDFSNAEKEIFRQLGLK